MDILPKKQKTFFDNDNNQYNQKLIKSPPNHVKEELRTINDLLKKNNPKKVIDFGAGSGRLTFSLLKNNYQVTATDISQKSLNNLYKLAETHRLDRKLRLSNSLNKADSVDAVVGTDILHHINLEDNIDNIYHCLNDKGVIIFSEPNAFNLAWYLFFTLSPLFDNKSIINYWNIEKGFFQIRYFYIYKLLKKTGFKNIKIIGYGLFPLPLFNWSCKLSDINIFISNLPIIKLVAYRFIIYGEK